MPSTCATVYFMVESPNSYPWGARALLSQLRKRVTHWMNRWITTSSLGRLGNGRLAGRQDDLLVPSPSPRSQSAMERMRSKCSWVSCQQYSNHKSPPPQKIKETFSESSLYMNIEHLRTISCLWQLPKGFNFGEKHMVVDHMILRSAPIFAEIPIGGDRPFSGKLHANVRRQYIGRLWNASLCTLQLSKS